MQTYNSFLPPRRPVEHGAPYPSPGPGFLPALSQQAVPQPRVPSGSGPWTAEAGEPSATPIFDALYSEFRRLFRALPGDRCGEEDLSFTAFGTGRATGYAPWEYGGLAEPRAVFAGRGTRAGTGRPQPAATGAAPTGPGPREVRRPRHRKSVGPGTIILPLPLLLLLHFLRPRFSRTRTEIVDRGADEAELLAQPALDEPPVAVPR